MIFSSQTSEKMKCLILDDNESICMYLKRLINKTSQEIAPIIFTCTSAALKDIENNAYDFAFIDIHLPEINGLEFAKTFKKKFPDSDIIFATGFGDYENAKEAIRIGAYDFIEKPFRQEIMTVVLNRIIEKRKLQKEKQKLEIINSLNSISLELAHELRNPLTVIGGLSKYLATKKCSRNTMIKYSDAIYRNTLRIEDVLSEILEHLNAANKKIAQNREYDLQQ